jgi:hypothetical protein
MIQLSKRLVLLGTIAVIIGALIKILNFPYGDYLLYAGFFISGVGGILDYITSTQRDFNAYAKLITSIFMCIAVVIDLIFGTNTFYFAVILLAISFFSAALPSRKISK